MCATSPASWSARARSSTASGTSRRKADGGWQRTPAVSLALAKRPGANAVVVSQAVRTRLAALQGRLIPADMRVQVTRDYGTTANDKANELLFHLALATVSIVVLIALAIGWREAVVTLVVIPTTILLTLFAAELMGYTINRVSLFALIFAIGILVDDAIVVVENIARHWAMRDGRNRMQAVIEAVAEVGNPTVVATLTVVAGSQGGHGPHRAQEEVRRPTRPPRRHQRRPLGQARPDRGGDAPRGSRRSSRTAATSSPRTTPSLRRSAWMTSAGSSIWRKPWERTSLERRGENESVEEMGGEDRAGCDSGNAVCLAGGGFGHGGVYVGQGADVPGRALVGDPRNARMASNPVTGNIGFIYVNGGVLTYAEWASGSGVVLKEKIADSRIFPGTGL